MKKSFMTRVLAVTLSAAMTFSLSSVNMMTASAAAVSLTKKTLSMTVGDKAKKLKLKNNSLNWKIKSASSTKKAVKVKYTAKYVQVKAKSEGKATIKVKVKTSKKKKNNTKLLKCKVTVAPKKDDKPDVPVTPEELTVSAKANSASSVDVTFSQTLDNELKAEDVSVAGEGVSVVDVTTTDRRTFTVTLTGAAASTEYTLNIKNIQIDGKAVEDKSVKFTTPASQVEGYKLNLKAKGLVNDVYIAANGASQAELTCEVIGPDGNIVTDDGIVVAFATDRGSVGSERVTAEKGVAKNTFRSESLTTDVKAHVTATIVEIGVGTNKDIMGLQQALDITMTPTPEAYIDGNTIVSAESNEADRVVAYFANDVKIDNYKTATGSIDASKIDIYVYDNTYNTNTANVQSSHIQTLGNGKIVDIRVLPENPKAMEILVDEPLTDNSNIAVWVADKTGKVQTSNTVYFKLTDARQPELVRVTNEGYRTLKLEFSEAVIPAGKISAEAAKAYAADKLENYRVDGIPLNNPRYGVENDSDKEVKVKVGTAGKGVDERHIVTITFGKLSNGKRFYLPVGSHSIQASNIGDWAVNSDPKNFNATQTLNFEVVKDDTAPTIESVDVQSPEQMLVTFNSDVEMNALYSAENIKGIEDTNNLGNSIIRLQQQDGAKWVDLSSNTDTIYKNPIRVTKVSDRKYLVEVTKDWTKVYKTRTTLKNYFNYRYRLHIDAEALENIGNGLVNTADINYNLDSAMITAPQEGKFVTITDMQQEVVSTYETRYIATISDPIKLAKANGTNENPEGLTPSEAQNTDAGVPVPTAEFVKVNGTSSVTVQAEVKNFANTEDGKCDKALVIVPERELEGGTWRLYLRSVSDDVGNTTPTLTKEFTVDAPSATNFEVSWAYVDADDDYTTNDSQTSGRYIFVKFSEPLKTYGTTDNVLSQTNYVLNGKPLPKDVVIKAGINGYDHKSLKQGNSEVYSITIALPQGEEVSNKNAILNIANTITSKNGTTLNPDGNSSIPGTFEYKVPYRITGISEPASDDAEWGNANSEKLWDGNDPTQAPNYAATDNAEYFAAVQSALNNNKYRKVTLSGNVVVPEGRTLRINRPVDLDLNGHSILGKVAVSFNDGATCNIKGVANSKITDTITINTPFADWNIESTVELSDVDIVATLPETVNNKGKIGNLVISGATAKIVNEGTIKKVSIETTSDVEIRNESGATVEEVVAERNVKVKLTGTKAIDKFVSNAAKVTVDAEKENIIPTTIVSASNGELVTKVAGTESDTMKDKITFSGEGAIAEIAKKVSSEVTVVSDGAFAFAKDLEEDLKTKLGDLSNYKITLASDSNLVKVTQISTDTEWDGVWTKAEATGVTTNKNEVTITVTIEDKSGNKVEKKVKVTLKATK